MMAPAQLAIGHISAADKGPVLLALGVAWAVMSLIGLVGGLKGRIVVYRGWGEVALAGTALLATACTIFVGSGGLQWLMALICALIVCLLLYRAYRTNGSVANAILTVLTQLFVVALLLFLLLLSLTKIEEAGKSKTGKERVESGLVALAAIAGAALATYLIFKLVRQGAQSPPREGAEPPPVPRA